MSLKRLKVIFLRIRGKTMILQRPFKRFLQNPLKQQQKGRGEQVLEMFSKTYVLQLVLYKINLTQLNIQMTSILTI